MRKNKKHKWKYQIDIRKKILVLVILGVSLFVGLGYALIETSLEMIGTLEIGKYSTVYWDNLSVAQNSVNATTPTITETSVAWEVNLTQPGDFYEFTIDTNNKGSYDLMVTGISNKLSDVEMTSSSLPSYISYSATYSDAVPIREKHLLGNGTKTNPTKQTYKVKVEFLNTITQQELENIPAGGLTYSFEFGVTYAAADSTAIQKPIQANFVTDSWDDIVAAYKGDATNNLLVAMNNGTTREVLLDLDHDPLTPSETVHVRIANLSKPAECKTQGFSQSACGFVVEVVESLENHIMNPVNANTIGTGNLGGWENSDMRAYLNSGRYLEGQSGQVDYEGIGMYDTLPSDLKTVIIPTTVVSGYSTTESSNYTTSDKLYLLDVKEVYGSSFTGTNNTAQTYERQLDYYDTIGVDVSNASDTIKKDLATGNDTWWWYRSPYFSDSNSFYLNSASGTISSNSSEGSGGVSFAFRIAD